MPCKNKWTVNWSVILGLLSTDQNEEFYKGEECENAIKLAWVLSLDRDKKCHRQRKESLDLKYNESDFSEQTKQMTFTKATKLCEQCRVFFGSFLFREGTTWESKGPESWLLALHPSETNSDLTLATSD